MRAAVYIDKGTIRTLFAPEPVLGDGDVLLKVRSCGVCGTDIRKVQLHLVKPPTVLGHEVAGDVVAIGPGVTKFSVGDRVVVAHHTPCYRCHYCLHGNFSMCRLFKSSNLDPGGFAEYLRIPSGHVELTAHKIPDNMSYNTAIFMEPLACVLRNLKRTTLLPGDTAVVIGLGSMGILTGQVLKNIGVKVLATDLKPDRIEIGTALGFDRVLYGDDPLIIDAVASMTEGRGADLVVLTAGTAKSYSDVIGLVRDGGSINIFAGLSPGSMISYDSNELYSREITLFSSYSPSPTELKEALLHLTTGSVNVDVFQSKLYPLEELPDAIEAVVAQKVLKAIIHPQEVPL